MSTRTPWAPRGRPSSMLPRLSMGSTGGPGSLCRRFSGGSHAPHRQTCAHGWHARACLAHQGTKAPGLRACARRCTGPCAHARARSTTPLGPYKGMPRIHSKSTSRLSTNMSDRTLNVPPRARPFRQPIRASMQSTCVTLTGHPPIDAHGSCHAIRLGVHTCPGAVAAAVRHVCGEYV